MSKIQEAVPLPLSKAKIHGAKVIVILTKEGYTAGLLAKKYTPSIPILSVAVSDDLESRCSVSVAKRGLMYRGIIPVVANSGSTEEATRFAVEYAKEKRICKVGLLETQLSWCITSMVPLFSRLYSARGLEWSFFRIQGQF
ncbi:hypothetical protein Bca52824_094717 [Brassica carinata]|uniref:Pyruvate kinase C-terminal domain-containing protein n=1 Tax=Brassica carinata TaxID=52824 RepID=A0A8X7P3U9_BRACI|nr:hypothetical protein Bca52824_094717 [Brassica carinata]